MTKGPAICIPVLRRYDLLRELLLSLRVSTVMPSAIHIVDNGRNWSKLASAYGNTLKLPVEFHVKVSSTPASVAETWNYFLGHTPDGRIITNDDILFGPRSVEHMVEASQDADIALGYGYSCFLIKDSCVEKIGPFDEGISPGYAYFEDCDYAERIRRVNAEGNPTKAVTCVTVPNVDLAHGRGDGGSLTYRAGSQRDIDEHWRKYNIAKANFVRKWGKEPQELEAEWEAKKIVADRAADRIESTSAKVAI